MRSSEENTALANKAFSRQAEVFDAEYSNDTIVSYKRRKVREHLKKQLKPSANILELNAGTGEDAIYLASIGHRVHCTDVSEKMLEQIKRKVTSQKLDDHITTQSCSFLELNKLGRDIKYDHVFSNFGGLNSTNELQRVLESLSGLVSEHGGITLVIMPKFCLWEILLAIKGNFKTAFRRFNSKGAPSHIEGVYFTSWYYHPRFVIRNLKKNFELSHLEGLCTLVPPSYLKNIPIKYPRLYNLLVKAEKKLAAKWPWKNCGDYYIISLKKIR